MAVVGNLELVVATKAQLQKALTDAGFFSEQNAVDAEEMETVWRAFAEADLLQAFNVEVELAIAVDFDNK